MDLSNINREVTNKHGDLTKILPSNEDYPTIEHLNSIECTIGFISSEAGFEAVNAECLVQLFGTTKKVELYGSKQQSWDSNWHEHVHFTCFLLPNTLHGLPSIRPKEIAQQDAKCHCKLTKRNQ